MSISTRAFRADGKLLFTSMMVNGSPGEQVDYTYDGSARLQTRTLETFHGEHDQRVVTEEHDIKGRLVKESFVVDGRGNYVTTWTYSGDLLMAKQLWISAPGITQLEQHEYDAENHRVRMLFTKHDAQAYTRELATERYTNSCGTGDLLVAERDANNDGVVDGRRDIFRASTGETLSEEFSGTFVEHGITRITYDYSCR